MRVKLTGSTLEVIVSYRVGEDTGGIWVPAEMHELYTGTAERLECTARYSKVRKFQVRTETVIK